MNPPFASDAVQPAQSGYARHAPLEMVAEIAAVPDRLVLVAELMSPLEMPPSAPEVETLRTALKRVAAADRMVLSRWRQDEVTVKAATDPVASATDAAQAACGQGPALDALNARQVCLTADVHADQRWPALRGQAPHHVHAALSIPLSPGGHPDVVLTAYSDTAGAFGEGAVQAITDAAADLALVLAASTWRTNAQNLNVALNSSRRIGMALGVLMFQLKLTDEQAFEALRRVSQHTHRKLREVAEDVLLTGTLPLAKPGQPGAD